jgi:transposase InsO family protein
MERAGVVPVRHDVSAHRGVSKAVTEPSAPTRSARHALEGSILMPQCLQRASFLHPAESETIAVHEASRNSRRFMVVLVGFLSET